MQAGPDARHPVLWGLLGVVLGGALLVSPAVRSSPREKAPEAKAFDPAKSPLVAVPPERYDGGDLLPAAILGDSTSFDLDRDPPTATDPFWHDLDVEGDYLFAATGLGLDVYDVSDPDVPQLLARAAAPQLAPSWQDLGETFYLESLDVPDGDASLVATAARGQGLIVWDVRDKSAPVVHYQDAGGPAGLFASQVYTAFVDGRPYAFVPSPGNALLYYDLTAAATYNGCLESTQEDDFHCPGVFGGITFRTSGATWVHGVGNFLVFRNFSQGVVILDVSNLESPDIRLAGQLPGAGEQVAMWADTSGNLFLGAVGEEDLWIYDVTCIRQGDCPLALPIATVPVPDPSVAAPPTLAPVAGQRFLTFSRSGPTPFLYVGNDNADTLCVDQREYLLDVSDPTAPRDVTPRTGAGGYWGWYYDACFTGAAGGPGFNFTQPRRGKFLRDRFYRAGFSFLDSHRYVARLAADFTWVPSTPRPGQEVQFTDTSAGIPDSWTWDFPGGGAADSLEPNPTWVFDSAGAYEVTLTVADASGTSSVTKTVAVAETPPGPEVDVTWVPLEPEIGQEVFLTSKTAPDTDFWHWRFENASKQYLSGSLRVHRTARVTFYRTGTNAVELWAAGPSGVGYTKRLIKVVPLEPVIEKIEAPASVRQCSPVPFTAAVTGHPPLAYEWEDPLNPGVVATDQAAFAWDVPDVAPGFYSTRLTVTNDYGTATEESPQVLVAPINPLRIVTRDGAPYVEKQVGASVTFRIEAWNAQEWNWIWGDGKQSGWTSNEDYGTNPTYFYPDPAGGTYEARVELRNCVEGPITSQPVGVEVAPFEPLEIVVFQSVCTLGFCYFEQDEEVPFKIEVTGFPQTYQYDWDGDLSFDEESDVPILKHVYGRPGHFRPRLRIIRAGQFVDAVDMNSQTLIVK